MNENIGSIEEQIRQIEEDFTTNPSRIPMTKSLWLESNVMRVFFRYGMVYDHSTSSYKRTATIAHIIIKEAHRSKGLFRALLGFLDKLNAHQIIIENILECNYVEFYESLGYRIMTEKGLSSPWMKKTIQN